MFDRTLKLIEKETFMKIQKTRILLIGLGGVGGYTLECLLRSGFQNITVIDGDTFEISNMNRQILCLTDTLGQNKVDAAKKRAELINPICNLIAIHKTLIKEEITKEFISSYNYIIDACDSKEVKIALMRECHKHHIKLISSMGTANRLSPEMLCITTLKNTTNDPLAKVIRKELRNEPAINTPVVSSLELPKKQKELGTIINVPMSAGVLLASYIIKDIQKETTY